MILSPKRALASYWREIAHQIALVEKQDHVLVFCILLEVAFKVSAPSSQRVSCIQDLFQAVLQDAKPASCR